VDLAIVGEPTRLRIVTAHKGVQWWELVTRGRAAHGARPELGNNAVHTMARIIDLLLTEYAAGLQARAHPLLGPPTISVGAVQGGRQPNIVPHECRCMIDRRTVPGEHDREVVRELKAVLKQAGLRADWRSLQGGPCPPLETSRDHPLVRRFLANSGQREPAGAVFFSDAGVLAQAGLPCVLFGPGDIAQAHRPDEWIDRGQLALGQCKLIRFLQDLV
jgi:acetylornithine deacetylase